MEYLTRSSLRQNCCSPDNFEIGEKVRLYTTYWGSCTEIEIIEGAVLEPDDKRSFCGIFFPAIRMSVTRRGRMGGEGLTKVSYNQKYFYHNIGRFEKLKTR